MFVQRDAFGVITGVFSASQPGFAKEELPDDDATIAAFVDPPAPQLVLPQDLMAKFTVDDAAAIQVAVAGNAQFWLLWSAMQTQRDPMLVTNARFLTGWRALIEVLGQPRMDAIASALNVSVAA